VLLKVAWMWAMPLVTLRRTRFFLFVFATAKFSLGLKGE
jgi:hypothetical protein